jgi:hypothetical protein
MGRVLSKHLPDVCVCFAVLRAREHVSDDSLQHGEAYAVASHDGMNDRIRKHLAERRLDPGLPQAAARKCLRQIRPEEFPAHGDRHSRPS